MKKVKALQYLVYITFGLFILQDAARDMYKEFIEGYQDGNYAANHDNLQRGPLVSAVLDGDFMIAKIDSGLEIRLAGAFKQGNRLKEEQDLTI